MCLHVVNANALIACHNCVSSRFDGSLFIFVNDFPSSSINYIIWVHATSSMGFVDLWWLFVGCCGFGISTTVTCRDTVVTRFKIPRVYVVMLKHAMVCWFDFERVELILRSGFTRVLLSNPDSRLFSVRHVEIIPRSGSSREWMFGFLISTSVFMTGIRAGKMG